MAPLASGMALGSPLAIKRRKRLWQSAKPGMAQPSALLRFRLRPLDRLGVRAEQRQQKRDFFFRTDLDHDLSPSRSVGRGERARRSGQSGFSNVSGVFRRDRNRSSDNDLQVAAERLAAVPPVFLSHLTPENGPGAGRGAGGRRSRHSRPAIGGGPTTRPIPVWSKKFQRGPGK